MPKIRIQFVPPQDPRFKETFFLVEASSFERQCLWKRRHDLTSWEDQNSGYMGQIGILARRPVVISVFWARINGRLVGFWESTSQVVDHEMIEKWFEKNCAPPKWDNGTRRARCDAMNFHFCMHAIQEANEAELSAAVT